MWIKLWKTKVPSKIWNFACALLFNLFLHEMFCSTETYGGGQRSVRSVIIPRISGNIFLVDCLMAHSARALIYNDLVEHTAHNTRDAK
jgi:hypothetical protein